MAKEIVDYREKYGKEPLWTNNMFSGMPAYQISIRYASTKIIHFFDKMFQLWLPHPANYVFLYMIGFFILMLVLGVNPWLSIAGAIAFAFSSYFFIILEAGHTNKSHAIGYMAPVLAGIIVTFRGKYLLGGILTAFFLAIQIKANHLQITYYLFLIILIYAVVDLIFKIREKKFKSFIYASVVLVFAALLAIGPNIANLWTTYEYGKYTIRGKSDLSFDKGNKTSGLDKAYATAWSYGLDETFTLLIPNLKGGSSTGSLKENSNTYQELQSRGVRDAKDIIKQLPLYWGTQSFTSGPVYVGAIIIFLFVLGLMVIKGPMRWFVVAATLLSILLSWGRNFMPLTDFFLDYVPGYNKFRTVSMTLVISELVMPLLGILALKEIFQQIGEKSFNVKKYFNYLKYAFFITGGLAAFFLLFGGSLFNFIGISDEQYKAGGYPEWFMDALREDRIKLFRADAFRSLLFIVLAAALLWAVIYKKIKTQYAFYALIILMLLDFWPVDKRYLNDDNFARKRQVEQPYQATDVDMAIKQDGDPYYRVFNTTMRPDQDARTSYFHYSIGGYHGAKLKRYQEMVDYHINRRNISVLNMLNTKYFMVRDQENKTQAQRNVSALGNAWFVPEYRIVNDADQEIINLDEVIEIRNLNPQQGKVSVNGREVNVDTVGVFQKIVLSNNMSDSTFDFFPYFHKFDYAINKTYIVGNNNNDTLPDFINITNGNNKEVVLPRHLQIRVISEFNPSQTAIVHKKFQKYLENYTNGIDTSGKIFLNEYQPNQLTYYSRTNRDQLTVFSDIYYDKGWNAYVDDKLVPHFRVNYILRAMIVPAGEHTIVFKFEPKSYYTGEKVGWISSIILMIILLLAGFMEYRKGWKKE
ncbi:YfhO family protein [candidate division KSB1 bacterium]